MERRLPAETRRRVCSFVVSWSVISEHRRVGRLLTPHSEVAQGSHCLLYTSDAADDWLVV